LPTLLAVLFLPNPVVFSLAEIQRQWDEIKHTWQSGGGKIWSLYEVKQSRSNIPSTAVVEAMVKEVKTIEGSQTQLIHLQDVPQEDDPDASPFALEWYMHGKYARVCSTLGAATKGFLSPGRIIRLVGCRTVQSPGDSRQTHRLLPNEFCALLLDPSQEEDAASLSETLVSDDLSRVSPEAMGCGESYTLRFVVKKVGMPTPTLVAAGHMVPRVRIWLRDPSQPKLVCLMLWGSQTSLSALLQRGMDLVLDRPLVKADTTSGTFRLEFGPETLLYIVQSPRCASPSKAVAATPMGSHLGGTLAASNDTPSRQETVDQAHAEDRIQLAGLAPLWSGITLLCTIKEARGNLRSNGKDRFVLLLEDGSGQRELSVWGEGAGVVALLQAGDVCLFEGLHTTAYKEGGFHLRGEPPELTFDIVSRLPGLLGSPHIAPKVSLKEALAKSHAVARVKIMGWPSLHGAGWQPSREACAQCQRPILSSGAGGCEHCQIPPAATQGEASPVVVDVGKVLLGDGSAMVQAVLSPRVLEFLAHAGSEGLAAMPETELRRRLDEATQKEFMVFVSRVTGELGEAARCRIDAIADVNDGTAEGGEFSGEFAGAEGAPEGAAYG